MTDQPQHKPNKWLQVGLPTAGVAVSVGVAAALIASRLERQSLPATATTWASDAIASIDYPEGTTHQVTTDDGVDLHVIESGDQSAPAVVLAHGWMANHRIWTPVAELLLDHGYRVITYDQRGHGLSTWGSEPLTMTRLGNDLRHVLEGMGLLGGAASPTPTPRPIVVGHSMGGMTVQSLLVEHPDLQDTLSGAVLVSTSARPSPVVAPLWIATLLFGDRRNGEFERTGPRENHRGFGLDPDPSHIKLAHEMMLATQGVARAACINAISRFDARKMLETVNIPVQIVVGVLDRLTRPSHSEQLADLLPQAELTVVNNIGHMLPVEDPNVVVEAIIAVSESRP